MIDIVLADDHELVRSGIRQLIETQVGMRVTGEAGKGEEVIALVRSNQPDIVLMDLSMPGMGGIEATSKLARSFPDVKVIALTALEQEPIPSRVFKAGAKGYLSKGCPLEELVRAITEVAAGKRYVSAELAQKMVFSHSGGDEDQCLEALSPRELQVMMMVTQGKEIQEISDALCLSPKTVSTYRYRVFGKLGVKNDVELTRYVISHGVLADGLGNV